MGDPIKQLELLKEARDFFNEGYSLFRQAMAEGPLRLNRDDSIDMWRANVQLLDDSIPALEAFIAHRLDLLMEPGQKAATRKQMWRLYFIKRDTGASTYEALEHHQQMREERMAMEAAEWERRRREQMQRERDKETLLKEYYRRVSGIYEAFGLHHPGWKQCAATIKSGYQCSNSANRFQDEPFCRIHLEDGAAVGQLQKDWEEYFGITLAGFDQGLKSYIVPLAPALLRLAKLQS